ncbi:MAG: AHH domain-containing protein, partial [Solirubrobacteraceae bacterium]
FIGFEEVSAGAKALRASASVLSRDVAEAMALSSRELRAFVEARGILKEADVTAAEARVLAPEAKAAGANGRVAGREATAAETRPRAGRVAEGVGTATAAERPILEQSALRESVEKLTVAERTAEFNVIVRTPLSLATEPGFVGEVALPQPGPGRHTWRVDDVGTWCRFSGPRSCLPPSTVELRARIEELKRNRANYRTERDFMRAFERIVKDDPELRRIDPHLRVLTDPEVLADNLTREFGSRPPGHDAHHIVPKGIKEAEEAREILREAGIGIHDAENGIWLPGDPSVPNPTTVESHSKVHTDAAIRQMTQELRKAAAERGAEGVRGALWEIRERLAGRGQYHPPDVGRARKVEP